MNKLKKIFSIIFFINILYIVFIGCASSSSQSKGLSINNKNTLFSKKNNNIKREALLLGISDYAGDSNDLNGIERDIEKMKKLFQDWGFNVKVLYDKDSISIVDYLDNYAKELNSNDYFAFYYSGHGSHLPDKSGDEEDGEDETLVLSDGRENTHLIDDVLYAKFNAIKAKKMIFFDSCHSGTVFRALNGKVQSKTISPDNVKKVFSKSLSITPKSDTIDSNSEYIVFSSSRDDEESLATPTGSLFTNSIYEIFSDKNSYNSSLADITKTLKKKVVTYAKEISEKGQHPNIYFSNSYSNLSKFKDFIESKSTQEIVSSASINSSLEKNNFQNREKTLQDTLDELIDSKEIDKMYLSYDKTTYRVGDSIRFSLDTKGQRGYLTIFYIDKNDVTILYPNPYAHSKTIKGSYTFPDDFSNGKFELEAYKSCNNCQEEKTVIYVLLSSEPILDINTITKKGELSSFAKGSKDSKIITRAVRIKAKKSIDRTFRPQLNRYSFIVR